MNPIYIRTANKKPTQKNFDFRHQGTSDFFKPQVIHCQRVIPGEVAKINCNVEMYSRPLAMPAGVRVNHNLRAFWVPAWAMHKDWFRFRTNVPFTLESDGVRTFAKHNNDTFTENNWLVKMFLQDYEERGDLLYDEDSWEVKTYPLAVDYDPEPKDVTITIVERGNEQNIIGYCRFNFSQKGKLVYNLLIQLGYEIKWILGWKDSLEEFTTQNDPGDVIQHTRGLTGDRLISARAILAFIKVMIDWYVPTQYEEFFEQQWEKVMDYQVFNPSSGDIDDLVKLLTWINYEQDRFTGAWLNPQGPNEESSEIVIQDITGSTSLASDSGYSSAGDQILGGQGKAPQINQNNSPGNTGVITDYILRALNAIQNYTTRNRIAGYRPIDRMLAHFGVHLDYKLIKRSTYITGSTQHFSQQATVNTANLEGALENADWLNDKGIIGGAGSSMQSTSNIQFTWSAEDDGYIIIIDTILPRVGYYQGMKHHNHLVDWRELYIPEFDNLGVEGIRRSEVFNAYNGFIERMDNVEQNDERIWGFEPTNAGIKTGYDTLSGDYRRKSMDLGIESMHTMRKFDDIGDNVPESNNPDFLKGDNEEYDRIFQYTGTNADHFQFLAVITDKGKAPWASISESLPITDGEGQKAKYNYGGSSYMN